MMLRYAITAGTYSFSHREASLAFRKVPAAESALLQQVQRLADARVDFIQLREKDLSAGDLADLTRHVLKTMQMTGSCTRLLLNSRLDVALATGAHGVHLTSEPGGLVPAQVRLLYRGAGLPPPVVSQACHTLEAVRTACSQAAAGAPDLILFSAVFGKQVAGEMVVLPAGLDRLHQACTLAAPIPVLALGGVTPENTPACLAAGARGVAGIRLFHL